MILLLAAILFGTPGPIEQRTYRDAVVSATIAFREARDRRFNGPEAPGPSVVTGTLTIVASGKRRSYDLTKVLPTHEMRIELPDDEGGCNTARALTRSGHYLAIETIIAQKGCVSSATFIDLNTGRVAEPVFVGSNQSAPARDYVHVTTVERVMLVIPNYQPGGPKYRSWRFAVVHGRKGDGQSEVFSYDLDATSYIPGAQPIPVPAVGSTVTLGFVHEYLDFGYGRRDVNERALEFEP